MPFVLRNIRRSKWYGSAENPWLPEGDLGADALLDLKTEGNKLSVWRVDDNESNRDRVITALAANRDGFSNVDYVLLDEHLFSQFGIRIEDSPGETPDEEANCWHCELVELSVYKVLYLVKAIRETKRVRVAERDIKRWLLEAVDSRRISLDRMRFPMVQRINKMRQRT